MARTNTGTTSLAETGKTSLFWNFKLRRNPASVDDEEPDQLIPGQCHPREMSCSVFLKQESKTEQKTISL